MSVHCCLLQSTETIFISIIARVEINFSVIQLPGFSSSLSESFCVFSTKSPRSDRPWRIYRADLGHRKTLGLQACLEWRLLSLLLPLQLKAAACQTFAGNIPGKPWRPIARTSFPLPSVFKPCNDIRVRTVLF